MEFCKFNLVCAYLTIGKNMIISNKVPFIIQWNLIIKRSDITKPFYNKVILLVPALYISLFFFLDIMRNLI